MALDAAPVYTELKPSILSANWKVGMDRPRAHSRVIEIPFHPHEDEPEANLLFAAMSTCRDRVSKSLGQLIQLSMEFERPETKEHINQHIAMSICFKNSEPVWCSCKIYNYYVCLYVFFIEVTITLQYHNDTYNYYCMNIAIQTGWRPNNTTFQRRRLLGFFC